MKAPGCPANPAVAVAEEPLFLLEERLPKPVLALNGRRAPAIPRLPRWQARRRLPI